jgi:hypothetical protein
MIKAAIGTTILLVTGAIYLLAAGSPRIDTPALTDENFAQWRDFIRPKPQECRWEQIPWQTSLWEAAVMASKQDKPVLLWAMNGHPLACT